MWNKIIFAKIVFLRKEERGKRGAGGEEQGEQNGERKVDSKVRWAVMVRKKEISGNKRDL